MRLQITVHRHGLAPVRNVFNTKAQQLQIAGHNIVTISDLLRAVDYIIPIVSEHWGCEDYAVETRLNDNQAQQYEVFHWQNISDVFSEDDEVVVRPCSTREIRERERNGRRQISPAGRRIYDGGFWNKNLLTQNRPAVHIPPRGSTQEDVYFQPIEGTLAASLEQEEVDEPQLQITGGEHWLDEGDDDDEEDDEDYEGGSEDEDAESDTSAEDSIVTEDEDIENESNRGAAKAVNGSILKEIVFDENGEKRPVDPDIVTPDLTSKKRKRVRITGGKARAGLQPVAQKRRRIEIAEDEAEPTAEVAPTNSKSASASNAMQTNGSSSARRAADYTSSDDDSDASSDSDDSNGEQAQNGVVVNGHFQGDQHSGHSSSLVDSESDTSSSASSDSDDESDSTSSSGESGSSVEQKEAQIRTKAKPVKETSREPVLNELPVQINNMPAVAKPDVAPGQGSIRTRKHNARKKKNKLMNRLKEEGKLPKDADFAALSRYLGEEVVLQALAEPDDEIAASCEQEDLDLAARRTELLKRLEIDEVLPDSSMRLTEGEHLANEEHSNNNAKNASLLLQSDTNRVALQAADAPIITKSVADAQPQLTNTSVPSSLVAEATSEESPAKRARLDVASSRRMLFSALGVRNPKTPAAEQALREKLSKPVRQVKQREADALEDSSMGPEQKDPDRWKQKLIIKAVECVQHKKVDVPPFPFKHPWQIRRERQDNAYAQKQYQPSPSQNEQNDVVVETGADAEVEAQNATSRDDEAAATHSTRLSLISKAAESVDIDQIPIPSDFDVLYDFQPHDLVEGAVIAYKELHVNERFEPAQSPYRVARIIANNDNRLQVRLAPECREQPQAQIDEDTGERVYSKFDVPDQDDEEPDDGLRDIAFEDMINPKFVAPSDSAEAVIAQGIDTSTAEHRPNIAIPASDTPRNGFANYSSSNIVSDHQLQVDTRRKAEIDDMIKEAGFESALDEQLLEPLSNEQHTEVVSDQRCVNSPRQTHDSIWHSSAEPVSSPARPIFESGVVRDSSVPSESMVESVRYPSLSQLGLDTPAKESSSHQEAQRMTPPPVNTSVLFAPVGHDSDNDEDTAMERNEKTSNDPSVILETQTQDFAQASTSPFAAPEEKGAEDGDPFQGLDRSESPEIDDNHSDEASMDSSGIPNLSQLSSQRSRSRQSSAGSRVKPEPTRRSPRVNKTASHIEAAYSKDRDSPPPPIKISASQRQPRLSQIPEDTIIVDLTQSSPPGSSEKPKADTSKRAPRRSLFSGSSQHAKALRQSFQGLGQSSLLRKKRTSS